MLATPVKAADLADREALAAVRVDLADPVAECEWDLLTAQCSCSTRKSSKN